MSPGDTVEAGFRGFDFAIDNRYQLLLIKVEGERPAYFQFRRALGETGKSLPDKKPYLEKKKRGGWLMGDLYLTDSDDEKSPMFHRSLLL